ncbi:hypothetical protein ACI2KC_09415 [Pseudomonas monteilii]
MQALHAAQFEFDNRLPCQVSETAEEAAQRAWVDNAVETLLDRQDVMFQRRLRKAQGVTHQDFAEAIDHFITDGGMDVSAGPAALGLLVLAGRSGVPCDVRAASAQVIPEAKLREIARELLEPLAADGVLAEAESL